MGFVERSLRREDSENQHAETPSTRYFHGGVPQKYSKESVGAHARISAWLKA
jgi:hypothetical protein